MAAIAHAFAEQNTNQTTTSSTFSNVVSIAAASLTVGKQYLIVGTAQLMNTTVTAGVFSQCRLRHGTTVFIEQSQYKPTTARWWTAGFVFVWTAVTGEDLELQFASSNNSDTVNCNFAALLAINLTDDLASSDWVYAERATDDALSATPLDGASITFTPGTASHDWLVLAMSVIDTNSTSTSPVVRINRTGEASSSLPEARGESQSTVAIYNFMLARAFTLGSASNTFAEQSFTSTGTSHTRIHSTIFALDLNKFKEHSFVYTEADTNLSATNYATQIGTVSLTPTVTGDVWIGGQFGFDRANVSREAEFRIQVDDSDQPAGQTTANSQFNTSNDVTDEESFVISTLTSLSNAAHTIDFDASADSATGPPTAQHTSLWAVTMELAAAAAAAYSLDLAAGSYALSGAALTPLAARGLELAPGAYAISGSVLTPIRGRVLNLEPATYAISGAALTPAAGRLLNLQSGSYGITGAALTTLAGRALALNAGLYAITGQDAFFTRGFFLNLETGSYTITGAALTPLANRVINLESGGYLINGAALTPLAGRSINLAPGVYALTGADLTPLAGRAINLETGVYVITGVDLTLVYGAGVAAYELNLAPGAYVLSGANLSTLAGRSLNLGTGAYALSGAALSALAGRSLNLQSGTYLVTGADLMALTGRTMSLESGVYNLSGAELQMLIDTGGGGPVAHDILRRRRWRRGSA